MEIDSIPSSVDEILSNRFLGKSFECDCGKKHHVRTRSVKIEPNVVERIPGLLPSLIPGERILLVADRNTWAAAGERLCAALGASHSIECCLLRDDSSGHIHASVGLVEEILAAYPDEYDGLVAVGSGTVNDLTRAVADQRDRPYFVQPRRQMKNREESTMAMNSKRNGGNPACWMIHPPSNGKTAGRMFPAPAMPE